MATIILESWRDGFEKVSLTKLQIEKFNISLKEAKNNVDSLLDNKKVTINIDNVFLAREFYNEATKIGVNCTLVE